MGDPLCLHGRGRVAVRDRLDLPPGAESAFSARPERTPLRQKGQPFSQAVLYHLRFRRHRQPARARSQRSLAARGHHRYRPGTHQGAGPARLPHIHAGPVCRSERAQVSRGRGHKNAELPGRGDSHRRRRGQCEDRDHGAVIKPRYPYPLPLDVQAAHRAPALSRQRHHHQSLRNFRAAAEHGDYCTTPA